MKMCSFAQNIPACGVHPVVSCGVLPDLWLEIRLEMLSLVVSWFPPRGVLPGLWLEIRLEMLSLVVSWFPPHGVLSGCGLKLDQKCCPSWCRGFHPVVSWCPLRGVVVSIPWCLAWLWLEIRLEMLSLVVLWFLPRGVVVSWFPPRGFHLV